MNEDTWVESIKEVLMQTLDPMYRVSTKWRLPYTQEVMTYSEEKNTLKPVGGQELHYETDLMIYEEVGGLIKPRIIIEAKYNQVSTHDAITYSHKASQHKGVTPYLRYGIMLGNMGAKFLPPRLMRHGSNFVFLISFKGSEATSAEKRVFISLIHSEWAASLQTEKLLSGTRLHGRKRYTALQNPLLLQEVAT
jgi:hypothetical protein